MVFAASREDVRGSCSKWNIANILVWRRYDLGVNQLGNEKDDEF